MDPEKRLDQADTSPEARRGSTEPQRTDTFDRVLAAVEEGGADDLIEALIAHGTLSPEARDAP